MGMGNDIGSIGVITQTELVSESSKSHRQVYQATHLSDGKSDSYMNRSFISFSYGGKNIEDFNLIACVNGDRMERQLTGNFNDLITSYDVINGQYYWGTYFTNNEMSFTLATDGITQPELEDFIHWFKPGEIKELILAEHPNRAIMARVAAPPIFSTIPFEKKVEFVLDGQTVNTSTTLYKGEIQLDFIMDDPFWYSKLSLLIRKDEENEEWVKEWKDANGNNVSVLDSKDALKIIYEDGIPILPSTDNLFFTSKILLGNNLFFELKDNNAIVGIAIVGVSRLGYEAYAESEVKLFLDVDETGYLYYAGTAPTMPKINFMFKVTFDEDSKVKLMNDDSKYCYISFIGKEEQKLLLSLPSVFYSYNQIIDIFKDKSIITFGRMREKIRENVHHYYAKKWASYVLNYVEKDSIYNLNEDNTRNQMVAFMKQFLQNGNEGIVSDYRLDAENNQYTGYFYYKIADGDLDEWEPNEVEVPVDAMMEDIGEIIRSEFITFTEKNHLNDNYNVGLWNEDGPLLSYKIAHNFNVPLENLAIEYKNKYY